MQLTSKEVAMVERLRTQGDGVFTVVRQGGDIRQVAKRLGKSVDAVERLLLLFPHSEGNKAPGVNVVILTQE